MKAATLARLMVLVGALGLLFLLGSIAVWFRLGQGLRTDRSELLLYLSLFFTGAFFVGLCQSWFVVFATWTRKLLPESSRGPSRNGQVLGVLGVVLNVALIYAVVFAGASSGRSTQTTPVLLGLTVAQATLIWLKWRWTAGFASRSAAAG